MCGLTSAFYPDGVEPPSTDALFQALGASLELIKHRGPDSRGVYVSPDRRVGLGHARLSIIDLSTGQQPLSDENDLIHAVVTGEIYDHDRIRDEMQQQGYSFKTKSDSELVVQLYKRYGTNMLSHLRGEFAFVLYDVERRMLFAARDRFGIKPLYYTTYKGCILFASEMKAFLGMGWKAEWDMESILNNADFCDERTVFRGAKKLAAGTYALCRASGDVEIAPYWDVSYPAATSIPPPTSVEEVALKVRELLVESVRLRLRSDVPWAVYLSGGIDSSAVAGIAVSLLREKDPNATLTTFTLSYVEDEATDETPLAIRSAAHLGVELVKVAATEARLVGALEESVYHSECPVNSFHAPGKILLSKAVREAGFKVALSGEGSDEIFGGYPWLPLDYLRDPDPAGASLGLALPTDDERQALTEQYRNNVRRMWNVLSLNPTSAPRLLNLSTPLTLAGMWLGDPAVYEPRVIEKNGRPNVLRTLEEGVGARVSNYDALGTWHGLHVAHYVTVKTLLGRAILNCVGDRSDMANAVESRVSFLDHHLVDYVNSLPPSLKLRPMPNPDPTKKWILVEKWILREAVKPFVTPEIYTRRKIPFNPAPANGPPAGSTDKLVPLQRHLKARITQEAVEKLGFVSWPFVSEALKGYLENPNFVGQGGIDPRARILMTVLSFIVLQEKFAVETYKA
ncbi:asparagine synthetase domain-containing protein [Favolaschia claudopus]|uniref:Asparagine synthetase domain-containing protein n=1 Tax=Favolaschia claudopus TaxID=2862362 RepID=A0AAW0DP51_9AGAR